LFIVLGICAGIGSLKNVNNKWLPMGKQLERFIADVKRVWSGAGREGLFLLQVGVSVPLHDVNESHISAGQAQ